MRIYLGAQLKSDETESLPQDGAWRAGDPSGNQLKLVTIGEATREINMKVLARLLMRAGKVVR